MKLFEMKRELKAKRDQLRKLSKRVEDGEELNDQDEKDADGLVDEIKALKSRIEKLEAYRDADEDSADDDQVSEDDEEVFEEDGEGASAGKPRKANKPVSRRSFANPAGRMNFGIHGVKEHTYSLLKALGAECTRLNMPGFNIRWDGLEKECNDEIAHVSGKKARGFYMPHRQTAFEKRNLTLTTGVGDIQTILSKDIIEYLYNKTVVVQAGAKVLPNMLPGNFAVPRKSGIAQTYWVAEGTAPSGSNQTLDQVLFQPKSIAAYTDVSRKFIIMANVDAEAFVRDDLTNVLSIGVDLAAVNGSGSGATPLGLLQNSSIPIVSLGTNGGSATYDAILSLEETVAAANAERGQLSYVTNAQGRKALKETAIQATGQTSVFPKFLWSDENTVNGQPAYVTQQVPNNLTKGSGANLSAICYGNFNDLVIAMWSGIDILVDPYTGSSTANVRVVAFQDCDIQLRHNQSFCNIVDLVTGS